ncbi:hypothetical protein [Undibacterium sp. Tian12W]
MDKQTQTTGETARWQSPVFPTADNTGDTDEAGHRQCANMIKTRPE